MKLGFVSAILADQNLEQVAAFASENGYTCVELMCWPKGKAERRYAGVTHVDVVGLTKVGADDVNAIMDKYGVEISGLGYYPNALVPDKEEGQVYIDHIKEVIKASALLGVNVMNSFIGRDWKKSVDDNWPRFMEVWPNIIKFAEDQGVKVAIENCPMYFSNDEWPSGKNLAHTPAIWRRMFNDIPSDNFGLNYDPSHLVWQHIDYLKPIWEFAPKIFHAHAKDVRVDKHKLNEVGILATPLEFHSPKLPGLGNVDWGQYFSVLGDAGYKGPVCVEVEDRAFEDSLEDRERALMQSANYLMQFVV